MSSETHRVGRPATGLSTSVVSVRLPHAQKRKIIALALFDGVTLNKFVGMALGEVILHRAELRNAPAVYFDHARAGCDD